MRYLVILAVLTTAGCGQTGALYLPEQEAISVPESASDEAPKQQPKESADEGSQ